MLQIIIYVLEMVTRSFRSNVRNVKLFLLTIGFELLTIYKTRHFVSKLVIFSFSESERSEEVIGFTMMFFCFFCASFRAYNSWGNALILTCRPVCKFWMIYRKMFTEKQLNRLFIVNWPDSEYCLRNLNLYGKKLWKRLLNKCLICFFLESYFEYRDTFKLRQT